MDTKILDLAQWNRLILRLGDIRGGVAFGVCAEGSDVYLSCRNGAIGINLSQTSAKFGQRKKDLPRQRQKDLDRSGY